MKKNILVCSVLGLMMACSGETGKDQPAGTIEVSQSQQEQIENIEQSTQKLEEVMDSTQVEIDTAQVEIDRLLNEI